MADAIAEIKKLLKENKLGLWCISNHLAGQLVCDPNDDPRTDGFAPASCAAASASAGSARIAGCPPPTGGGIHLIQMLNVLEGYDCRALGFGTVDGLHLLAEVMKIAFADRAAATGDPAFVDVPVARLLSRGYAGKRARGIDPHRATPSSALPGVNDAAEEGEEDGDGEEADTSPPRPSSRHKDRL